MTDPYKLMISHKVYVRLKRDSMTKRAYRRWRARLRARIRALPDYPEGVWERDGQLVFECRACGGTFPLECDLGEYDPEVAYCGGNPRCLP